MSLRTQDQSFLRGTEIDSARTYVEIASRYGVRKTLFITGKCVVEESDKIRSLIMDDTLELGGHTYFAFKPRLFYKLSNRILKLKNGPYFVQMLDITWTIRAFLKYLNYDIISWRNHAYRNDRNSPKILHKSGIEYFSDACSPDFIQPFREFSLIYVPINVLPDHDYIYHGSRTQGSFDETVLLKSAFKVSAMPIDKWFEIVATQITRVVDMGGVATILAHPSCMEIADNFKTFQKLCEFISQYENLCISEIEKYV
jgi:hypothetical protein